MTTQATPPTVDQQLTDARIASAQAQVRIRELEAQVVQYRQEAGDWKGLAERRRDELSGILEDARALSDIHRADLAKIEALTLACDASLPAIKAAYLRMLQLPFDTFRMQSQHELALLRDAIAEAEGLSPLEVQNTYEYRTRVSSNQAVPASAQQEETQL